MSVIELKANVVWAFVIVVIALLIFICNVGKEKDE